MIISSMLIYMNVCYICIVQTTGIVKKEWNYFAKMCIYARWVKSTNAIHNLSTYYCYDLYTDSIFWHIFHCIFVQTLENIFFIVSIRNGLI